MRIVLVSVVLALFLAVRPTGGPASSEPVTALQGRFMVGALASYSNAYWARVAGRDTGLPPRTNGHDELAARWTQEMLSSLHGLHAGVFRQSFPTPGFNHLPATRPGMNVIVSVPGSRHPERAIVVGTHYDGEPFSKGSAFDDTSGSVITLALARALGQMWRAQGAPALTVEFVLFDAEEQGLVGSTYYASLLGSRAILPKPVLMINEEQSGVGYPVRPFGLASQNPLPSYASTVKRLPAFMGKSQPINGAASRRLLARLTRAVGVVYPQLRSVYSPIPYRGGDQPAFTDADRRFTETGPSAECCSDNDPFELHGIPNVTFSGNYDFYSPSAEPWAFPFDQPTDTFTALACDTGGSPQPSLALEAALDLPFELSVEMIRAYAPSASGERAHALSTAAQRGKPVRFTAIGKGPIRWNFGDHTTSAQRSPSHTYTRAGTYSIQLQAGGTTTRWTLSVSARATTFRSLFGTIKPPPIRPWHPEELGKIAGCH